MSNFNKFVMQVYHFQNTSSESAKRELDKINKQYLNIQKFIVYFRHAFLNEHSQIIVHTTSFLQVVLVFPHNIPYCC